MYIDASRVKDLETIKGWLKDPKHSKARKQMYLRTYRKIQAQMLDTKLSHLRERLVRATKAEDTVAMWKLTNQIKDYAKEELIGQRYE